ncbi:hypothetical protein IV203_017374 [Nitzschia inconspicua]|uniref:Uncharacterized protein n=1 Tax=Nitzschia inconspicua TaxID=303405 RepID=A0A9K3KSV2_9STRA|nr:hypothetical protein IV203_017374 [Nitzschia inconspicua]
MTPSTSSGRAVGLTALAAAATSASRSNFSSSSSSSSSDLSDNDNADDNVDAIEEVTPPSTIEVAEAYLEDVALVGDGEELSLVQKIRAGKEVHHTKIKSIVGHSITSIPVGVLRTFCSRNGVLDAHGKSTRNINKKMICDRIVLYLEDTAAATSFKNEPKTTSLKEVETAVNRTRMINVLFGDKVRPQLHTRAKCLTKDELTQGLKTGQEFYELVSIEYNSKKREYGEMAYDYPSIKTPPSKFSPIDWKKAKIIINKLLKDYEEVFSKWKRSGTNDQDIDDVADMVCTVPFRKFTPQAVIAYMHEFVVQHPSVFEKAIGHLPDSVFVESITMDVPPLFAKSVEQKGKKAAAKLVTRRIQEFHNAEDLFFQRKSELRAAVEQAENFDSNMDPKKRRLEIDRSMARRIKIHKEWCQMHDSDDDSIMTESGSCASKLDRYFNAKRNFSAAKKELKTARREADQQKGGDESE